MKEKMENIASYNGSDIPSNVQNYRRSTGKKTVIIFYLFDKLFLLRISKFTQMHTQNNN